MTRAKMQTTRLWLRRCGMASALVLALAGPAARAQNAGADADLAAGMAAFKSGDMRGAIKSFKASLKIKENFKAALYLGNIYLQQGKLGEAERWFKLALKLDNGSKRAAIQQLLKEIKSRNLTTVTINSNPAGATVFVDKDTKSAGVTPLELDLSPGKHSFRLEFAGYQAQTKQATLVEDADNQQVAVDLVGLPCSATFSSETAGATIAIDGGNAVGLSAVTSLPPGVHTATLAAPGFVSQTLDATCSPGGKVDLQVALAATPGRVKVPTVTGTVITVDGVVVELNEEVATSGLGLAPGKHEVTIAVPGKPAVTKVIEVESGKELAIEEPAPALPALPAKPVAKNTPIKRAPNYHEGTLFIGVAGGGNVPLTKWNIGSHERVFDGANGISAGSAAVAGLRVGYQIKPRLLVDAEASWISLPSAIDTSTGAAFSIGGLYHILPGKFTPTASAGAGVYQVVSGMLGSDTDWRAHVGVGVRTKAAPWLVLRADARNVFCDGLGTVGSNLEILASAELPVLGR